MKFKNRKIKLQQLKFLLFINYLPFRLNFISIGTVVFSIPVDIVESGHTDTDTHIVEKKSFLVSRLVKKREKVWEERKKKKGNHLQHLLSPGGHPSNY